MKISVVREIFTPLSNYPHITADESLSRAIEILMEHQSENGRHIHYDVLFVVGSQGELAGELQQKVILENFFRKLLLPTATHFFFEDNEYFADMLPIIDDWFKEECGNQSRITVETCMCRQNCSVEPSVHVVQALSIMLQNERSVLPVTKDNVLLGAVRMEDIFNILGNAYPYPGNTSDSLLLEGKST